MSGTMWTVLFGSVFLSCFNDVLGNGRMLVPPQRSSLWRDPQFYRSRLVVKNYDDHTLNCGGFWKMHENDGRCGICGDPWDAEQPRPNEAGGLYARGVIGRTYSTDKRFIDTVIQVTSSMSGFFEFNICPNDNIKQRVKQECLDQFPLRILSKDRSTSYGRRYHPDIKAGIAGIVELSLEIPEGLECKQCVLRWRWHGANNYGICRNGNWGKGCGEQPEIYNCADIAILPEHVINGGGTKPIRPTATITKTTRKSTTTTTTTTTKPTTTTTTAPTTTTTEQPATTTTTPFPSRTTTTEGLGTTTTQQATTTTEQETTTAPPTTTTTTEIPATTATTTTTQIPAATTTTTTSAPSTTTTTDRPLTISTTVADSTTTENTATTPTITEEPASTKESPTTASTTTTQEPTVITTQEQNTTTTQSAMTTKQETVVSTNKEVMTTTTLEADTQTQEPTTRLTTSTLVQTTVASAGSTSGISETTTTGPSDVTTLQRGDIKTSPSVKSETTSETPFVQPESQDSVNKQSTPAQEETQTEKQINQSTVSVMDVNVTTSDNTVVTETTNVSDKVTTQTTSTTGIPLVQTDTVRTDKSTTIDLTSSNSTQEQTTATGEHTAEVSVPISTKDTSIEQPKTEVQNASTEEVKNTSVIIVPNITDMVNATSSTPVGETTAQSNKALNISSDITDNIETKPSLQSNVTDNTPVSDIITAERNISSSAIISDQAAQPTGNDQTASQLERISENSSATTITNVTTETSGGNQDSSSTVGQASVASGAVTNEMMTVVNSDSTVIPIKITRKPVIENTTTAELLVSTTDALNQLTESSSVAPSSTKSIDTSSTQSTISSTHSSQPLVTGGIVTSTGTPKASTSRVSLVDLLNAMSKLENVSSDALIDAISPTSNSTNSSSSTIIIDNILNGLATVTDDNSNATSKTSTNTTTEGSTTTQSPQSSTHQVTEIKTVTGSSTEFIVNPDAFNIVTSRTTRISRPQGGRLGGGISVTKIAPVDNIVNIDLNIPGGEANLEKERRRLSGVL